MQSPKVQLSDNVLSYFISSIKGLLRGYTFLSPNNFSLCRESPLTCSSAIQTNSAKPYIELNSNSYPKESSASAKCSILYYTETVGDVEYEAKGFIDIQNLQFLSCDDFFW